MSGSSQAGGIFISYRRSDTRGTAGRLYDDLVDRFGVDHVYRDIDAIELGVDFTEAISQKVRTCDALIAVIGNQWVGVSDGAGNRRLDDPNDLVRLEISAALEAGKLVIPVLVEDATMPATEELPEPLAPLPSRHALSISDLRWQYDVERLITRLGQLRPVPPATGAHPPTAGFAPLVRHAKRRAPIVAGAAILGLVVLVAFLMLQRDDPPPAGSTATTLGPSPDGRAAYQTAVRGVCDRKARDEGQVKARSNEIQQNFQATGDFDGLYGAMLSLAMESINDGLNLGGTLKALSPPADLSPIHKKAVDAWDRQIEAQRAFNDGMRKAGANGLEEFSSFLTTYDGSAARTADDEVNQSLIQLAGSDCRPAV